MIFKNKRYICKVKFKYVNNMDIVSRIKFFLDSRNIANSQFADRCEIPRPTVSQLLNGRNKKVSDEVISKIHTAYPELSIMWLLFGEEPMILGNQSISDSHLNAQLDENAINTSNSANDSTDENLTRQEETRILFDERESPAELGATDSISSPISKALENFVLNNASSLSSADKSGTKHIVNVMVLYSDNSFVSFVPERSH